MRAAALACTALAACSCSSRVGLDAACVRKRQVADEVSGGWRSQHNRPSGKIGRTKSQMSIR
eukprot:6196651-Pleurochrysis_carterae.AAC.4